MTPEEQLKKNQRALNKAMRELDRERAKMEQQEKKLIMDIKKMAKAGQMDAVKIMAKDLVRTRKAIKKFMMMKEQMKLPEIQKIMQEFEKQSEIMDMKEEMMN